MCVIKIEEVTTRTLPQLAAALRALSADLGDTHRAGDETLRTALFGAHRSCHAILAFDDNRDDALGAALFSPMFSTTFGTAGTYVSDLWVCEAARGQSLGARLLNDVRQRSANLWGAVYISLVSYDSNDRALAFYRKLGFETQRGETRLIRATGRTSGSEDP